MTNLHNQSDEATITVHFKTQADCSKPLASSDTLTVEVLSGLNNEQAKAAIGNSADLPATVTYSWKTKPSTATVASNV